MAILVDHARWDWRETTWCHLISDTDFDELHTFAGELGCRRVGFQGDHYDIDIDTRTVALELGAMPCESREIVRRLKLAGLRKRPSTFDKWELDYRIDDGLDDERWDAILERHPHARRLPELRLGSSDLHNGADGCFVLRRPASEAVVVHGYGSTSWNVERPDSGLFARTDHRGHWALESIWPAPGAHE